MMEITQSANALASASGELAQGELYAVILRLHALERGSIPSMLGRQLHAAFLDVVNQHDPALAKQLHQPHHRRPFTVGLLQGFNHHSSQHQTIRCAERKNLLLRPGDVFWLRITMLDASIFQSFANHLLFQPQKFIIRLDGLRFEVGRLILSPESDPQMRGAYPWIGFSSFVQLHEWTRPQNTYVFEFATPTAFSFGQHAWGKQLQLFPESGLVFDSLAKQWECFAPAHLRMATQGLTPFALAAWCTENVIPSSYSLRTIPLPFLSAHQGGFQGRITYEVKTGKLSREAAWLSPLAHFARFSGVGMKNAMGMGQTRCINLTMDTDVPSPIWSQNKHASRNQRRRPCKQYASKTFNK